jgi:hypothetical protein
LGLGEKEDDLQIFNAEQFANAFIQSNWLNFLKLKVYKYYIQNYF